MLTVKKPQYWIPYALADAEPGATAAISSEIETVADASPTSVRAPNRGRDDLRSIAPSFESPLAHILSTRSNHGEL
jgi:hypothetical protein